MHEQYCVLLQVVDKALQVLQQNFIMAFTAGAQAGVSVVADIVLNNPLAGAFAARLVIAPNHLQADALQHIQETFRLLGNRA